MKKIFMGIIKGYQRYVSPFFGQHCRFYPSCSEYARQSIEKKGVLVGGYYSIIRLFKCHPFHSGGFDPVKE
ncbi:MAG: membrane protein insertion efficiency factor YidD [Candidatus Ancaeobacter aquaticus]|nr:membrane protein insertion efficiency factor YidD [Candidatus Ancaeobacter aquaticus]